MRTVIFGSGDIKDYQRIIGYLRADDFIVCADGGYRHAEELGLKVDLLLGDMDSIGEIPSVTELVKYPVKKDMTDSQIALERAAQMGSDEIIVFGFTGDRADHTLNNYLMLLNYPNAVIIDDNNEIRLLKDSVKIKGHKGQTVSIIPIAENMEEVTTKGLEYPLNGETLYLGDSRGVSNVMTSCECEIECKSGMGLIIKVEKV